MLLELVDEALELRIIGDGFDKLATLLSEHVAEIVEAERVDIVDGKATMQRAIEGAVDIAGQQIVAEEREEVGRRNDCAVLRPIPGAIAVPGAAGLSILHAHPQSVGDYRKRGRLRWYRRMWNR